MSATVWQYQGEAGAALDATMRPMSDLIGPRFVFPSLGTDELTYSLVLEDLVPSAAEAALIPQDEQAFTVWRDGVRFFTGTVRSVRQSDYTITVKVAGPWWDLEHNPLTTAVTTSGGSASVRMTYAFAAGASMTTSWGALLDRAIATGVPLAKGTLATTFNYLPVTLNQMSCAGALTELVRLIPDAMTWVDYAPAGLPRLNITRRKQGLAAGSAEVITLDARDLMPGGWEIDSVPQYRISQVRVPYLDRGADGLRRYQEQSSGTAEVGHVQVYTASGEELDTFLPNDGLDSYFLKTVATSGSDFEDWVLAQDGDIINAAGIAGVAPSALPLSLGGVTLQYATTSTGLPTLNKSVSIAATSFTDEEGNAVALTGKNILVTPNVPDWLADTYTVTPIKISGSIYYEFLFKDSSPATTYAKPAWWFSVNWAAADTEGFRGIPSDYETWELFVHTFQIQAYLINTTAAAGTTVYKQPDYTFISPPAGFAAGLLGCQNWTPHAGRLAWQEEECGSRRYLGRVVNVTNAMPTHAAMLATVVTEELDLDAGITTLTLGTPAKLAFLSVIDKQRTHSAQQIAYL